MQTVGAFRTYFAFMETFETDPSNQLFIAILLLIGSIIAFSAFSVVLFSQYKVMLPLWNKIKEKRERSHAAKREKKLSDKQKRLEKLQAEMDELKRE